jgi:hypothetical protein
MTYRPTEESYGPPLLVRLPSVLYLLVALGVLATVAIGEASPADSWLFKYVVEADAGRYITSRVFAALLLVSALASFIQTGMRGVRVRGDGVEYRDLVNMVWPRIKKYKWAQIDRLTIEKGDLIVLDLWNGDRALLPPVMNASRLVSTLEKVALARAIPITGGHGVDEIPEPGEYDYD